MSDSYNPIRTVGPTQSKLPPTNIQNMWRPNMQLYKSNIRKDAFLASEWSIWKDDISSMIVFWCIRRVVFHLYGNERKEKITGTKAAHFAPNTVEARGRFSSIDVLNV